MRPPKSSLPLEVRCRGCNIGIFRNEAEAATYGKVFVETVNLKVGDCCIGCAVDNKLTPEQLAEMAPAKEKLAEWENEPPEIKEAWEDYWNNGGTVQEVGEKHGVPNLWSHVKRLKLPTRTLSEAKNFNRENR